MKAKHVTIGAVVAAAAIDIGRELVIDEAESLLLKALRAFWAWLQQLFNGGQRGYGWA